MARIVHVLPADLARGAQVFARLLRETLDGSPDEHLTLTLFASAPAQLRPDVALGVRSGTFRRAGLDPRAVVALRKALGKLRADVVVAHGGEALKYATLACPDQARLVYKKTGTSADQLGHPLRRALHRWLVRRPDVVVAVSDDVADEACGLLRLQPERVVVAPNGRDPAVYRPRTGSARQPPRLIFVGQLTAGKRPERFLQLIRALRQRGLSVDGTLVGEGPLFEPVESEALDLYVEVYGRREDVPELLAEADVLVFPGTSDGEGMPGVLIEAGLSGLPAVTTAVSGARTVVDDGVTGFIVPTNDFDALVDAAETLVTDSDLRASMGIAARQRCVEHLTLTASAHRWQTVFDGLVRGSPLAREPRRHSGPA